MAGEAYVNFLAVSQGMWIRRRRLGKIAGDISLKNCWNKFNSGHISTKSFILKAASMIHKTQNVTQYESDGDKNNSDVDGIEYLF